MNKKNADYDLIKKELDKKFLKANELGFRGKLNQIINENEIVNYEIGIKDLLRRVSKEFSSEHPPKLCEKVLMKKLDEVYLLYNKTKSEEYQIIFTKAWKVYNGILNSKIPNRNVLNLEKIEQEKLINRYKDSNFISSEEIDEETLIWKRAIGMIE